MKKIMALLLTLLLMSSAVSLKVFAQTSPGGSSEPETLTSANSTLICPANINDTIRYGGCKLKLSIGEPTFSTTTNLPMSEITISNNAPADSIFPVGETVVRWVAKSIYGDSIYCDQIVKVSFQPCPDAIDYEGTNYQTVRLGSSCVCWTTTNLRSTKYSDGRTIDNVMDYYSPDHPNTTENVSIFGHLYNWYAAVDTGRYGSVDSVERAYNMGYRIQGICPDGWFLPSDEEYAELNIYPTTALKSTGYWINGANNTNSTGFNSLPGGMYSCASGRYENIMGNVCYWTCHPVYDMATGAMIDFICEMIVLSSDSRCNGYSIRCIYDSPVKGLPTVTTHAASNVSSVMATCGGNVTSCGSSSVTARGVCWSTSQNPTVSDSHTTDGSGTGSFTSNITGLTAGTIYYVRAYATNSAGTSYGNLMSFTTLDTPTVTTDMLSNITTSSATCGGNVTSDGGANVTARGVCWSTSQNPTVSDSHTTDGSGTGNFTSSITGLTAGTTYYVRAYATNSEGTAYGIQVSFTAISSTNGQPCPGAATVIDIDNNTYNTVQIGDQCWMRENLRTTHYANGTSISLGSSTSTTTAYRYYPNNNSANVNTYGYLYNWKAVMGSSSSSRSNPSGVQGICPTGWHVPSDAEWTQLTDYVSSQTQYQCNNSSDNIAKALASTTGWDGSTHTCVVGNNPSTNNSTGFSALPAGSYYGGNNTDFGFSVDFWSTWERGQYGAYCYYLYSSNTNVGGSNRPKHYGYSVRCVRYDISLPTVTTDTNSNITTTSITCGGNVTSDGGSTVSVRGVCWSTSQNPTLSDSYTNAGSGMGSFTSNITALAPGTTYYVRAYAVNARGIAYGNILSFTTKKAQPCPGTATVTDIDGNVYNTVQIGNQCWMKENLRTTRYANGTSIPLSTSTSTTTPYRYNPYNGSTDVSTYGYLYNWPAVMHGASSSSSNPSGVQGICPTGWHVPSDAEWTQLTDYVSSQSEYVCGENTLCIAKALASSTGWNSSTSSCWVGYNPSTNNATGFSALPAGCLSYGEYVNPGASFWSASSAATNSTNIWVRLLRNDESAVTRSTYYKAYGISVRCVKGSGNPAVTTATVTSITGNSATCGGNVTSDGGANVTARGVCWSTSQNPTVSDSHTTDGSGTGSFTSSITGLTAGTTYYVRAYASNSVGTSYGVQRSFTTLVVVAPTLTTNTVSNITSTSATCGGNVTSDGGATVTARGVCWSTSQNPTVSDSHTTDGSGTGSFTSNITGLTAGTIYYVRAYATNSQGTAYGNELSFTTTNGKPCPGAATVIDIDNNTYNTVQIGDQCWMRENLRTTRYADGTTIPLGTSTSTTTSYRYYPNNDADSDPTLGYLYNWPAVMHGASSSASNPSGVQGICPTGWHVPSDTEWEQLMDYVGSQTQYQCNNSSDKIAKALSSTTGWCSSTYFCAVGNDPGTNNATGFSAVHVPAGGYVNHDSGAYFWSARRYIYSDDKAYYNGFNCHSSEMTRYYGDKYHCLSVRCVKDFAIMPTVTTSSVTSITANSATCGGNVTSDGGAMVTERGVCWSTSQNPTVSDSHTTDGSGTGSFTSSITGLTAGTTYYVRAYATNSAGTSYGILMSFTTLAAPTVTTDMLSNITTTSAICGGNVTSDGGANVTARGVCWSTSQNPTVSDSHTTDGSGTGSFTSNITGLTAGTTYYVRAYATNSEGTAYGIQVSFTAISSTNGQPCPGAATVIDIDNNTYNTVQIGDQCWMRENLRTTRYADGTTIPLGTSTSTTTTPSLYPYDLYAYRYLYNWPAVMHGASSSSSNPSGVQGICPTGWHVPSDAEWTQLTDYVSSQNEYVCGGNTLRIAKALASTTVWSSSSSTCAVGKNPGTNNATGFSALPAGYHSSTGYLIFGDGAYFWSATDCSANDAYNCDLYYNGAKVNRLCWGKDYGFSVRCVRD